MEKSGVGCNFFYFCITQGRFFCYLNNANKRTVPVLLGCGLFNIHHIEEHEAGMFIFFLFGQFLETVFAVELYS